MSKKEFVTVSNDSMGKIGKYDYLSSGIYEEKKSKFYSYIFRINGADEAIEIINKMKQEFKDARHVVYCYVLDDIYKYSDDGEPSGTAGKMIYSLLEKQNITNTLVIVVRYFGGILLGAGPLSRAYLKAVKDAEEKIDIVDYVKREEIKLVVSYSEEPLLRKTIDKVDSQIVSIEHGEKVTYIIRISENDINLFDIFKK